MKKDAKVTVYLTPELRKALRLRAINEGTTVTGLIERLVTEYLRKKER